MRAIICDACGKVLKEEDANRMPLELKYAEFCAKCFEKVKEINEEYSQKRENLYKEYYKLKEEYNNKLKEIGIEL